MELSYIDHVTLCERLEKESARSPLCAEALSRIRELEKLCGMMTDTGVILEEDVADLVKADTWWLPDDSEYSYTDLLAAMQDICKPGDIVEWGRAHTLTNGYALLTEDLLDPSGKVIYSGGAHEYETYEEAEEARAEYNLRRRRLEFRL